jgi:hypothetical protein
MTIARSKQVAFAALEREQMWLGAIRLVLNGKTFNEIGTRLHVSRERVRQRVGSTLKRLAPELGSEFERGSAKLPEFLRLHHSELLSLVEERLRELRDAQQ